MAEDFETTLLAAGVRLEPARLDVLQINVGKLCNMSCKHCHVDAGPHRVAENMDAATADACIALMDRCGAHTVDITGGAPELNPHFERLVVAARSRGLHVIDRCNLSVLLLARSKDLPAWLAAHQVEVVASLPHFRAMNTDAQRGEGAFERSIQALRLLNQVGYGQGDPERRLTLMHNPSGAFLPGGQSGLEKEYRRELGTRHGVQFDRLIALNNMPISRFKEWLDSRGQTEAYMSRLMTAFNPVTVPGLMCRNTLSVSWDGRLFDCDFNQMLDLLATPAGRAPTVADFDLGAWQSRRIQTGPHCYGCTAGCGSSCGGATA